MSATTADATAGPPLGSYPPAASTTPTRARERVTYDRALVHSILDAAYLCHLGFVADGRPVVLPTLYARDGERLYLHGSTGARALRHDGLPVCVTVTHVDGLVLAKSAFHHSINYRSVVVHGTARRVTDPARARAALDSLVNAVVPGRAEDCRPANAKELAATAVLELDLAEVSAKVRVGGPHDDPADLELPHWSGVVPVRTVNGTPLPAEDDGTRPELPRYLREFVA
ncbi:pyridoxamine 5'-phosphate oxidase family protein [Streptomyces triticirhizae]|uniref:Pyridoxamine 5'-phosphate oxidase family protein n=1 Tax=Streptomyces triticirhizae TaxID=2483353 RepID=A0A3M2LUR0_9ACTN|nr:pyridoxamine 5'-phosphate oxidase family protein [Streptomyces triticirhizae]RMI41229.1 pyridoxamine 5'-phosphate oxidase family protein [Streptomyces triticirhizae]